MLVKWGVFSGDDSEGEESYSNELPRNWKQHKLTSAAREGI